MKKRKSSNERWKNTRRAMWKKDPRCRLCGVLTILPEVLIKKYEKPGWDRGNLVCYLTIDEKRTMATIDHIFPKGHPMRGVLTKRIERWRLLCNECNFRIGDSGDDSNAGIVEFGMQAVEKRGSLAVFGEAVPNHKVSDFKNSEKSKRAGSF